MIRARLIHWEMISHSYSRIDNTYCGLYTLLDSRGHFISWLPHTFSDSHLMFALLLAFEYLQASSTSYSTLPEYSASK